MVVKIYSTHSFLMFSKTEVISLLDFDTLYEMRKNNAPVERDALFDEAVRCGMVKDNF